MTKRHFNKIFNYLSEEFKAATCDGSGVEVSWQIIKIHKDLGILFKDFNNNFNEDKWYALPFKPHRIPRADRTPEETEEDNRFFQKWVKP